MKKNINNPLEKTYRLTVSAMFAALLCISAYISIPLPNGTHITFLNFFVTLIVILFSPARALSIIGCWMLLGLVGLPVFTGGISGIGYLLGPYGGYNFAFLITAILIPAVFRHFYKHTAAFYISALTCVIFIDFFGAIWWMFYADLSIKAAFVSGFLVFIPLDVIKAFPAAKLALILKRNSLC